MSSRLLAAALALTTVSGCVMPRAALVAGAVTTTVGGVLLVETARLENGHSTIADEFISGVASRFEVGVGVAIVALGLGLVTSGVIGLRREPSPTTPLAPLARDPAPLGVYLSDPATFAPPSSATAALAARSAQLTTQIWIEIRAGHCATAIAAARRLAVLDRDKLIALIDRNVAVASCVAYRM
jgi:hypothetical protein